MKSNVHLEKLHLQCMKNPCRTLVRVNQTGGQILSPLGAHVLLHNFWRLSKMQIISMTVRSKKAIYYMLLAVFLPRFLATHLSPPPAMFLIADAAAFLLFIHGCCSCSLNVQLTFSRHSGLLLLLLDSSFLPMAAQEGVIERKITCSDFWTL